VLLSSQNREKKLENKNLKKNNTRNANSKNIPIVIVRVNPEELVYKNEDEIRYINDKLNKNLRLARSKREDKSIINIEKEVCYIQRELESRMKRKETHNNFIKNNAINRRL